LDEGVLGMIVVSKLFFLSFVLQLITLVQDLFFQYSRNNFLHSAVYDFLHQVLTGRVNSGYN
jgi:hypothetical protein